MNIKIVTNNITDKGFKVSSFEELISGLINNIPGVQKETINLKTFGERLNFLITSTFPLTIQTSEKNRDMFTFLKNILEQKKELPKNKSIYFVCYVGGMESYVYFYN